MKGPRSIGFPIKDSNTDCALEAALEVTAWITNTSN